MARRRGTRERRALGGRLRALLPFALAIVQRSHMLKNAEEELKAAISRPGALCPEDLLELAHRCVRTCRECPRGSGGTPAVTGSGPASARLMLVGGEPHRDDAGRIRLFTGAAANVLHQALRRAGIGVQDVYFTVAVKHGCCGGAVEHTGAAPAPGPRLEPPVPPDDILTACRRLLEAEMLVVKPEVVLCLGSTAARAILGQDVDRPAERGKTFHPGFVPVVMVTVDPRSVPEHGSEDARRRALDRLVLEFYEVAELLGVSDPFKGRDELAQL
jgi:uracil-DNA glycosylase